MKTFKILFVLLLFTTCSLSSCSNDDNDDPQFNVNFLKQTGWTGTLEIIVDGEVLHKNSITIYFTTDSRGNYTLHNDNFDGEFDYILDDKLLKIIGDNRYKSIIGDWILLGIKSNRLLFRKGLTDGQNYSTLDLTRLARNNASDR